LNCRLFAFVGIEDNHYTLNIVLNENWKASKANPLPPKWHLLHFDSFRADTKNGAWTKNLKMAKKFALWALNMDSNDSLQVFDIPVPQQDSDSNDCGLCATHFLRVFLSDIQRAWDFCIQVSFRQPVNLTLMAWKNLDKSDEDREVRDFWDEERMPSLRREALRIFDFYEAIDNLLKGGPVYPNYVDVVEL
jgi:Ulp1 family protease